MMSHGIRARLWAATFTVLLTPFLSTGQDKSRPPTLHSPDQILKIMEASKLSYIIAALDSTDVPPDTPRVLGNTMVLRKTDGGYSLVQVTLSDEASSILSKAEDAFSRKEFEQAFALYGKTREADSTFVQSTTLQGDVRYAQGQYEEAKTLFLESIAQNFIDYDAHWFLADTYARLVIPDSATIHYTMAHLLNRNHQHAREALTAHRLDIGRPWKEWTFKPSYVLSRSGDRVSVKASSDWLGYAIVKAVWEFEPGYADSTLGKGYPASLSNTHEEKEAVLACMSGNNHELLERIISDGFVDEFILYEIIGPKAPEALLLLAGPTFMRLVEYVDKYH